MNESLRLAAIALLALAVSRNTAAQAWSLKRTLEASNSFALTSDLDRRRIVLSDPPRTWEWNGSQWSLRATTSSTIPGPPVGVMAYDRARQRVIVYTGTGQFVVPETWEWDGVAWRQRFPVTTPPARFSPAMTYDAARQRIVLWGGSGTAVGLETWEWDGNDWVAVTTATTPSQRTRSGMAYDEVRERVVLFGGLGTGPQGTALDDTWEYDGVDWRDALPSIRPPARMGPAMAWDPFRQRIVLRGGSFGPTGTWEWDGTVWAELAQETLPNSGGQTMAFDAARGRVIQMQTSTNEVEDWDGTAWSHVAGTPTQRARHALARDPDRWVTVLFGGSDGGVANDETWEWDGFAWRLRRPASSPPALDDPGLAYDRARQRVVLFGGESSAGLVGDTWTWDGAGWTREQPAIAPSARISPVAYDAARGETVLFGGGTDTGSAADTWIWDGAMWTLRSTASGPSARQGHALAYDPQRQRVVLFGGLTASGTADDTWEWDGIAWTRIQTPAPPARQLAAMTFHPGWGAIVLHGGIPGALVAGTPVLGDTWLWDGASWTQLALPPGEGGPPVYSAAMTPDEARGAVVLHGGRWSSFNGDNYAYTWLLAQSVTPANAQPVGFGCGGQSVPALEGFGYPMLGNTGFQLDVTRGPRLAPGAVWIAVGQAGLVFGGSCVLWVDPTTLLVALPLATGIAGDAAVALPIPTLTALTGIRLLAQGFLLDPASPPLGAAFTDLLRITFGE